MKFMGQMKNYLLRLQEPYPEFGAQAIEHAIFNGMLKLSYNLLDDERRIGLAYDVIIEAFREVQSQLDQQQAA